MNRFTCPNCGGKLDVNIKTGLAVCQACGNATELDAATAEKLRSLCADARRLAQNNTAEGYREAISILEPVDFIGEVRDLTDEYRRRLGELEADRERRTEEEQTSGKKNTALGVVILVIALLLVAGLVVGAVYLIKSLAGEALGALPLPAVIGVVVLAAVLLIANNYRR